MSKLIVVSEYVKLPKLYRPPCIYQGKVVLTAARDIHFPNDERYVIFCALADNQTGRYGARYPGELLQLASK